MKRFFVYLCVIVVTSACAAGGRGAPTMPLVVLGERTDDSYPYLAGPLSPGADVVEQHMGRLHRAQGRGRPPMTHLVRGALGPGQEQAFEVTLHGSSCYTMLAVAESTDQEVDLHLLDGRGGELAQDRTMGHRAAIEHCPPRDGAFRIVVRMYRGSGRFGLQLFGS